MRRRVFWLAAGLVAATTAIAGAKTTTAPDLTVHEWGTFLAMAGSDGVTLDGMYHEEHALPGFVHARSKDQLRMPAALVKGETPVIYFYTPRRMSVSVKVQFPKGIWTQWYPQAAFVGPSLARTALPATPGNGVIGWNADLTPASSEAAPAGYPTAAPDALWNHARKVDAAWVTTHNKSRPETDRFLFYRGLGEALLPLEFSMAEGGTLKATSESYRHLFVMRVEKGKAGYRYLPALSSGETKKGVIPAATQPMSEFTKTVSDDLAARLEEAGLYPKEARAMVNTWKTSYFQQDGIRVLFLMPQSWTDAFIPMTIDPQPAKLVRVMVGRMELLSGEREQLADQAVQQLFSSDADTRERGYAYLQSQGRYVEPVIRRVMHSTKHQRVEDLCNKLLLSDFVTELRASVLAASDGHPVPLEKAHMRAQLASLLREIGLRDEATAEAQRVLSELPSQEPPLAEGTTRRYLRVKARAMEGLGDRAGAMQAYTRFIEFGAQVKTKRECLGCHTAPNVDAPRDMSWFRDWWAGRKYAQYARRVMGPDDAIAEQERALAANPSNTSARMMLAYLQSAAGHDREAQTAWRELGAGSTRASAQ